MAVVVGWGGSVAEWLAIEGSLGAEGPGYKLQPRRCPVTVLGKLFTRICSASSEIDNSPLKGCEGNCGPGGK